MSKQEPSFEGQAFLVIALVLIGVFAWRAPACTTAEADCRDMCRESGGVLELSRQEGCRCVGSPKDAGTD